MNFCADDYGLTAGIDDAILELSAENILSSVSVMTIYPDWKESIKRLSTVTDQVDIGLHFCITGKSNRPVISVSDKVGYVCSNGFFLSPVSLFLRGLCGQLDKIALRKELAAQYSRLESVLGPAQHMDGHHHCHQWPRISSVFLEFVSELENKPCVRHTTIPFLLNIKNPSFKNIGLMIIGFIFSRKLRLMNIKSNDYFYTYKNYSKFCKKNWLTTVKNSPTNSKAILWAVHPSKNTRKIELRDSLIFERVFEYECLLDYQEK